MGFWRFWLTCTGNTHHGGKRVFKNSGRLPLLNGGDHIAQFLRTERRGLGDQQNIIFAQFDGGVRFDRFHVVLLFEFFNDALLGGIRGLPTVKIEPTHQLSIGVNHAELFPFTTSHRIDRTHQFIFDRNPEIEKWNNDFFQTTGEASSQQNFARSLKNALRLECEWGAGADTKSLIRLRPRRC